MESPVVDDHRDGFLKLRGIALGNERQMLLLLIRRGKLGQQQLSPVVLQLVYSRRVDQRRRKPVIEREGVWGSLRGTHDFMANLSDRMRGGDRGATREATRACQALVQHARCQLPPRRDRGPTASHRAARDRPVRGP